LNGTEPPRVQVCNSVRVGTTRVAYDLNPQETLTTAARLPRSSWASRADLRSLTMTTLFRHCEGEARSNLFVRVCIAEDETRKKGYPPPPPQGGRFGGKGKLNKNEHVEIEQPIDN
jgi:hypothetical protein